MTDTDKPEGGWEPWKDNPSQIDQPEGAVLDERTTYVLQTREPSGKWVAWLNERTDREEVTRIQAHHLSGTPGDRTLRVLSVHVTVTVDEVPGTGEGQTPPEQILARNEETTKRLLAEETDSAQTSA